jgi:hypothetical protein
MVKVPPGTNSISNEMASFSPSKGSVNHSAVLRVRSTIKVVIRTQKVKRLVCRRRHQQVFKVDDAGPEVTIAPHK